MYRVVLIAAVIPALAGAQQPKVEEQTVAPNEQGMAYSISPKGAHVVAITQKGTRWVVLHDGVPGPLFDQIISSGAGGRISFSPDGTRFGYVGRQGQEWVAMVDGTEVLRRPIGTIADPSRMIWDGVVQDRNFLPPPKVRERFAGGQLAFAGRERGVARSGWGPGTGRPGRRGVGGPLPPGHPGTPAAPAPSDRGLLVGVTGRGRGG